MNLSTVQSIILRMVSDGPGVILSLLLATAQVAAAADPLELEDGDQPSHLEPVPPRSYEDSRMLDKQLLVTSGDYGRMILVPAFEGPTAVSVYGSAFTDEYPKQPWSFHITVTKANKSRGSRLKITRLDVSIDREFAVAIQRAWATMLLDTRYPQKSRFVMDGYTAEFSVFVRGAGILYGRIQTPETGLPKEFVEIGLDLVAYCSASEKERLAKRNAIIGRLEKFTEEAAKASKV